MKALLRALLFYLPLLANGQSTADTGVMPPTADPVATFIRTNPGRTAITLVRNDTTLISRQADQKMPLASTVKIVVAIEFAKQAAAGRINLQEMVPLSDLDLYYIPDTDGNAHPNWKMELISQKLVANNRVPLLEVAKGMIKYSSNANTEYLMERLGFANINANLTELSLPRHDRLIPMVAPLMLYSTKDKKSTLELVRAMSNQEYEAQAMIIHQKLKQDADGSFKKEFIFPDVELQKLWSDRLTASTVREYASIMQKLNKRTHYAPAVQSYLDQIMEWPLAVNPGNRTLYEHLGMKGGSTAFVLTSALYATTKDGNRSELAFFFDDLTSAESEMLKKNANTFILNCIQANRYRETVSYLTK
ncbi:MAG: serine hydrolase [Bacteroidetes bacterium]|nr:serine hydrolase [Fibrella sp.]